MIERRARSDQHAHDLGVAKVCGGNQRGAVVAAGNGARVTTAVERDAEHRHVVGNGSDRHDVVAVDLLPVRRRAQPQQGAGGLVLSLKDGDMQRRAAAGVGSFLVSTGGDKPPDG